MEDDYEPVSCSMYDELEELAVMREDVRITYKDDNGEIKTIVDMISNFKTKDKKEYLILSNAQEIRLDNIVKYSKK